VVPGEVEEVLAAHPAVAEAAVVGLPDREWGEIVAAFVALRSGADASVPDLEAFCRERLPGYKRPRRIMFVDALPRSHYGKVLKAQLVESAQ
jgi:fatty-acyl-CoA synthase